MEEPNKITIIIITIIISQIFTVVVLLITNYINRRHATRLIEDEVQVRKGVDYLQEQLSKFYGPIFMLLAMNKAVLDANFGDGIGKIPKEIWEELRDNIMIPNNSTIIDIIKGNFHLMEGTNIPPHVVDFLVNAQVWSLSHKHNIARQKHSNQFRFPPEFSDYISNTTQHLKDKHNELVKKRFDRLLKDKSKNELLKKRLDRVLKDISKNAD